MAILTLLSLLFIFSLIGFSPALVINKENNFSVDTLSISPALGIAIVTIVGNYLVNLQVPISVWANYFLLICTILSLFLISYIGRAYLQNIIKQKQLYIYLVTLFVAAVILLLPFIIGKLNFALLRGNGVDQFNYITIAYYLVNYKLNFVLDHVPQFLVNNSVIMGVVRAFIETRWSTAMLLGWMSAILKINVFKLEYIYSMLFLLSIFGISYAFIRTILVKQSYSLLVALAVTLGFWSQFIVDLNAMSQLNSISLIILASYILIKIDTDQLNHQIINRIILGIVLASIAYLYTESFPTVIIGLSYYIILSVLKNKVSIKKLLWYLISIGTFVLLILPSLHLLTKFLFSQMQFAADVKDNWADSAFPWLYKNSFIGFWGMDYVIPSVSQTGLFLKSLLSIGNAALLILSVVLTYISVIFLGKILVKKESNLTAIMIFAMIAAGFTEFAYLVVNGQWWAAGKSLSYIYPYFYFILSFALINKSGKVSKFIQIGKYFVIAWLVIQCSLGYYRIDYAKNNKLYPNYIGTSQIYFDSANSDWNLTPITHFLARQDIKSLGLFVFNPYQAQYLDVLLHSKYSLLDLYGSSYYRTAIYAMQTLDHIPNYFIVSKDQTFIKPINCLAENSYLCLVQTPKELYSQLKNNNFAILFMVGSPYGQSLSGNKLIYPLGENPAVLQIYSYKPGLITLNLTLNLNSAVASPELFISNERGAITHVLATKDSTTIPNLPVIQGINTFNIALGSNAIINATDLYVQYQTNKKTID